MLTAKIARRLTFEHVIGRGGYGTVWKGTCREGGGQIPVAIKTVDMRQSDMRRVELEAEIFLKLSHPNLVTCFGEGPGLHVWLMIAIRV